MATLESNLVAMVGNAFDGVVLGDGESLCMTEYFDSGGCAPEFAERAKNDERINWRSIPDSVLEQFQVTFSFTDLLGYRFYAAPYMIWTIENHRTSDCFISDATIYAMDPKTSQFSKIPFTDWFTPEQIDAILAFLDYCADNGDSLDDRAAIENASAIRRELNSAGQQNDKPKLRN